MPRATGSKARGRFLLLGGTPEAPRLGVIFPPGYPIVLAIGFLFGAPLWVGPIIAALLVAATYALGKAVTGRDDVARLAAVLSVVCATLRYHTADTMSHGWAAFLFAASLALAFGAVDADPSGKRSMKWALSGALFGWLFATRPISSLVLLPLLLFAASKVRAKERAALALGAMLPIGLFLLQQRSLTGSFFVPSQAAYYAVADGPPGCFRYGFGRGIGCLHEHGSFVAAVLPNGLDWKAAAIVLLRRLRLHVIDIGNVEPMALLALAAPILALATRRRCAAPSRRASDRSSLADRPAQRTLALAAAVLGIFFVYAPFYFDGSYIATAVALLVERARSRWTSLDLPLASAALVALGVGGFGVHAVFEHLMLRDREGGRPFFEPSVLAEAKIDRGLLFVGTDHAFNLAYDPGAHDAARELVVAREHGDDRDRLVWERLGRPQAHRYIFEGRDDSRPAVVPWSPGPPPHPYRFEAEAEWPPIHQRGGSFEPVFAQGTCAWGARLLAVNSEPDRPFDGTISFPVPANGTYRVGVHVATFGDVTARFVLRAAPETPPLATWTLAESRRDFNCATLTEELANLADRGWLEVTARGGSKLFVDAVALEPVESIARGH
jgi:hypothetical protein